MTELANKAVFWDRDGTLLKHFDYLVNVNDVALIRGAAGAVRYLGDRGYKSVVVTNQSAVARGMITEKELAEINRRFTSLLFREGATIDKLYYCPYHPEAVVEEYRKDSDLRKPSPGMLLLAAEELDLDLTQCWMIGDDDRDVLAGQAAGCRTILIRQQATELVQRGNSKPDFEAYSPQEAANIVAHHSNKPEESSRLEPKNGQTTEIQIQTEPAISEPTWAAKTQTTGNTTVGQTIQTTKETDKNETEPETSPAPQMPSKSTPKKITGHDLTLLEDLQIKNNDSEVESDDNYTKTPKNRKPAEQTDILHEIHRELRRNNVREESSKPDFSGATLIAGVTQILVLLCLIMAYTASGGEGASYDKVHAWLLTGLIFQVMTVSLMMMNR